MGTDKSTKEKKNSQLYSELVTLGSWVFSVALPCLKILLCGIYWWDVQRRLGRRIMSSRPACLPACLSYTLKHEKRKKNVHVIRCLNYCLSFVMLTASGGLEINAVCKRELIGSENSRGFPLTVHLLPAVQHWLSSPACLIVKGDCWQNSYPWRF